MTECVGHLFRDLGRYTQATGAGGVLVFSLREGRHEAEIVTGPGSTRYSLDLDCEPGDLGRYERHGNAATASAAADLIARRVEQFEAEGA